MSNRDRKIVRAALKGRGMRVVTADYMHRQERPLPLPLFPGLIETQIGRQVEYHNGERRQTEVA